MKTPFKITALLAVCVIVMGLFAPLHIHAQMGTTSPCGILGCDVPRGSQTGDSDDTEEEGGEDSGDTSPAADPDHRMADDYRAAFQVAGTDCPSAGHAARRRRYADRAKRGGV